MGPSVFKKAPQLGPREAVISRKFEAKNSNLDAATLAPLWLFCRNFDLQFLSELNFFLQLRVFESLEEIVPTPMGFGRFAALPILV